MVSEPVKTEISFMRQGRNRPMEWCCCCDPGLDCLAQCSHITKEAVLLPVSIDASWVKDLQEREGKLKKVSSLGKTAHVYTCVSIRSAMAGSDRDLHERGVCRLQSEHERLVLPIATIVATVDKAVVNPFSMVSYNPSTFSRLVGVDSFVPRMRTHHVGCPVLFSFF